MEFENKNVTLAFLALCFLLHYVFWKELSLEKFSKMPKSSSLFKVNAAVIGFCLNNSKASSKLDCHYFLRHDARPAQESLISPEKVERPDLKYLSGL